MRSNRAGGGGRGGKKIMEDGRMREGGRERERQCRTWSCEANLLHPPLTFRSDMLSLYFSLLPTVRGVRLDFWLTDLTSFFLIVRLMVSDSGISLRASLQRMNRNIAHNVSTTLCSSDTEMRTPSLFIHSFIHLFQNPTDPGTGHINHWI
jgi:hypothetical protein